MSSTFGGVQQAANSLAAARYGLEIVSQNIANADTPGYTRQASQQATVDSVAGVPYLFTRPAGPGGVTVVGTSRLNDPVLDARARTEHARSATADTTATQMSNIEQIFPEPSDTGLGEQLSDFWNTWSAVATDPGSEAPRAVLLQNAATVAGTLRAMSTSLDNVAASATQSLNQAMDTATSAAGQLATVNNQIAIANATGANANSLLDQRDQLLDQLSTLVGGKATFNANGTANVTVGGQTLVDPAGAHTLSYDAGTQQVQVDGSTAVTLDGGSALANLTIANTTVPGYQAQLNAVAQQLATAVNNQQAAGQDLNGTNPGAPIFVLGGDAHTIAVSTTITADQIAAAANGSGKLDGSNAVAASKLGQSTGTPPYQAPDDIYQTLVGRIAGSSSLAQQQSATQDSVTKSVDALRTSASGVSYDEEVSNMMTYQRAYQASSRVLTTLDSMLDTLINHTGLVGSA